MLPVEIRGFRNSLREEASNTDLDTGHTLHQHRSSHHNRSASASSLRATSKHVRAVRLISPGRWCSTAIRCLQLEHVSSRALAHELKSRIEIRELVRRDGCRCPPYKKILTEGSIAFQTVTECAALQQRCSPFARSSSCVLRRMRPRRETARCRRRCYPFELSTPVVSKGKIPASRLLIQRLTCTRLHAQLNEVVEHVAPDRSFHLRRISRRCNR